MAPLTCDVLVVGGGPAGLRAAEIVSAAGFATVLADRMPSVGRKFLVAGRGGLNLTHSEPAQNFPARYGSESTRWEKLLAAFSPADLQAWVEGLGVETFVGTSGRIFPEGKKAAPLLRRWVARLRAQGVRFALRHELASFPRAENQRLLVEFSAPTGSVVYAAQSVILALGGASWPQTGSNGAWTSLAQKAGLQVIPLAAANCGYEVAWPADFLAEAEGLPLKNLIVRTGGAEAAGELLITRYGLEGGALYQLGRTLRGMTEPTLEIDLKPTFTAAQLAAKLSRQPGHERLARAAAAWKLSPAALALLRLHAPFASDEAVATTAKALPVSLRGPRPLAEAISTAGGLAWDELDDGLMARRLPGLFFAGEMIDWDAPTGGYLLQGCLSTGSQAGRDVVAFLNPPGKIAATGEKNLSPRRGNP
jgi:uncharacterized flavoprotein (TIGR03862 family)